MSTPFSKPEGQPLLPGIPAAHHGRGERILHVDDEPTVTTALQRLLQKLGYRIESFNSPLDAAERLRATPHDFDLVLTDLMMPGMTGLEIADLIRTLRPEVPVVLLSAFAEGHGAAAVRASGIREIIVKPAGIAVIAAALRRAFDHPVSPA